MSSEKRVPPDKSEKASASEPGTYKSGVIMLFIHTTKIRYKRLATVFYRLVEYSVVCVLFNLDPSSSSHATLSIQRSSWPFLSRCKCSERCDSDELACHISSQLTTRPISQSYNLLQLLGSRALHVPPLRTASKASGVQALAKVLWC